MARVSAERVALNARDAGLSLQTGGASAAALHLVRIPLPSVDPRVALTGFAEAIGLPAPSFDDASTVAIYRAENTMLQAQRIIPLLQLPACYVVNPNVRAATPDPRGNWHLERVWLGGEIP